jgi:hypothetical protein
MADAIGAAFSSQNAALFQHQGRDDAMLEMMFMVHLARRPIEAIARKWMCRSLHRFTKGEYRCPDGDKSRP